MKESCLREFVCVALSFRGFGWAIECFNALSVWFLCSGVLLGIFRHLFRLVSLW